MDTPDLHSWKHFTPDCCRKRKKEYNDPIGPDLPSSDRKKRRRRERSSHR